MDALPPRAAERFRLDSIAIVRGSGGQVFRTRDLSELGVFLFSRSAPLFPLVPGHTFDLDVFGRTLAVRCRAVIARIAVPGGREEASHPHGFAARLLYGDHARPRILDLVREVRRAGAV